MRHLDRQPGVGRGVGPARLITAIAYLNPDWEPGAGGCLRLHVPPGPVDVAPRGGRVLLFRSDAVEHEVLPSHGPPRYAVTMWMYGEPGGGAAGGSAFDAAGGGGGVDPAAALGVGGRMGVGVAGAGTGADACDGGAPSVAPPLPLARLPPARRRVFVTIPCYRDSECQHTLRSLFAAAARPEDVFVGVCWQMDWVADGACFQAPPPRPGQVLCARG